MTERIIGFTLTDDEIKKLHAPLTDRPLVGMNLPCLCPVCKPPIKREPVK